VITNIHEIFTTFAKILKMRKNSNTGRGEARKRTNKTSERPSKRSSDKTSNRSSASASERSSVKSSGRSSYGASERSSDKTSNRSSGSTTERSSGKSSGRSSYGASERFSDKTSNRSSERSSGKPSERSSYGSSERSTDKPYQKENRFKGKKTNTDESNTDGLKKSSEKKGYKLGEKIRLNRFLANSGVCSRREADQFIATGCVTVNGSICAELGTKVSLNDDVRFNGEQLNPQNKVYLLLNKPKGFVTTTDDPQERKTVMDLVNNACPERIYPVGRLDKETTGLLLFTNDGDIAKKLTHPSYQKKKIYHAFLDKPLTKNHLLEMANGVELEDGIISADAINYVDNDDKREIGIEIHSGRNRIIRRFFAHMGYEVLKLDRVYFAGLTKKNIPRGKYRFLTPSEINQLKMH
jgi:23S rRNA pseudouridine2605 synthase